MKYDFIYDSSVVSGERNYEFKRVDSLHVLFPQCCITVLLISRCSFLYKHTREIHAGNIGKYMLMRMLFLIFYQP